MEDFYVRLGEHIRAARTASGVTQQAMADRLGLNRTTMVNIEKGRQRLSVHQLVDLADALGCEPCDLLPGKPLESESAEPRDEFVARVLAKTSQPRVRP
jgi:transcriptional regulator with XRE-family HTH domain